MKRLFMCWTCLVTYWCAFSQQSYEEAMRQGDIAFKNGEYKTAINKYFAAEAYDPTKKELVKKRMDSVFNRIDKLRKEAEAAKKQAEHERNRAMRATNQVTNTKDAFRLMLLAKQTAERDPTIALRIAEAALKKDFNPLIHQAATEIYTQYGFYKKIYTNRDMRCAALSPDGTKIASGQYSDTITLSNIDGSVIRYFTGLRQPVMSISFSPDGSKILTGGYDGIAILWNVADSAKRRIQCHSDAIMSVCFSPDGTKFITGGYDKKVKLWNVNGESNQSIAEYLFDDRIECIAFSGSQKIFVSTGQKSWSVDIANSDTTFIEEKTQGIGYDHKGSPVIIGTKNNSTFIVDSNGHFLTELRAPAGKIKSVCFSRGADAVLTGSEDGTIRLWDRYGEIRKTFSGHHGGVIAVAFAPGGESFYSWSQDKTVRFWRIDQALEKEYRVKRMESFFQSVDISPDRQQFLALLNRHNAEIYSIHGDLNKSIKLVDTVESMQFSADGQKLITYSETSAQLLDLSGNLIARLPAKALDISSNGKHIVVGLLDGIGQLLNADGKVIKTSLIRDTSSITAVVFSPDGNKIATGCNHSHIHLWTIDGRQVTTLELDDSIQPLAQRGRGVVESLLFSKDGRKLYASLRVQHSRGYVNKGFVLDMNKGLKFEVSGDGLVFSPDGEKILDFSFNTAKLLNADGKLLHEYDADHLASAAFSKDGKTIIAIFNDGLVRLWKIHVTVDEFLARNEIESLTKEERDEYGIE